MAISSCIMHEDRDRPVFHGKTLYYVERSMAEFVTSRGALGYLVPPLRDPADYSSYAQDFHGLLLVGGVDVSPRSYGETPLRHEWSGDAVRDAYELSLLRATLAADKPVLAICRGHQLLNVARGGTLHQDIVTQVPGARVHRDAERYDGNEHEVVLEGSLAALYGRTRGRVNSVHHQSIKELGEDLEVEARDVDDHTIEAVRSRAHTWVYGVQWHPEFRAGDPALLSATLLLDSFMNAMERHR